MSQAGPHPQVPLPSITERSRGQAGLPFSAACLGPQRPEFSPFLSSCLPQATCDDKWRPWFQGLCIQVQAHQGGTPTSPAETAAEVSLALGGAQIPPETHHCGFGDPSWLWPMRLNYRAGSTAPKAKGQREGGEGESLKGNLRSRTINTPTSVSSCPPNRWSRRPGEAVYKVRAG